MIKIFARALIIMPLFSMFFLCLADNSTKTGIQHTTETINEALLNKPLDTLYKTFSLHKYTIDTSYAWAGKKVKVTTLVIDLPDSNKVCITYFGKEEPSFGWLSFRNTIKANVDTARLLQAFPCGIEKVESISPMCNVSAKELNKLNMNFQSYEITFCRKPDGAKQK